MNADIAVVVPAQKILETLMQEDVAEIRRLERSFACWADG
jgi:hypothetical protein